MVLAGLDDDVRRGLQVLGDLIDNKIERLRIVNRVVGNKAGVSSQTRFGLLFGIVLGRRYFVGLKLRNKQARQYAIGQRGMAARRGVARKCAT